MVLSNNLKKTHSDQRVVGIILLYSCVKYKISWIFNQISTAQEDWPLYFLFFFKNYLKHIDFNTSSFIIRTIVMKSVLTIDKSHNKKICLQPFPFLLVWADWFGNLCFIEVKTKIRFNNYFLNSFLLHPSIVFYNGRHTLGARVGVTKQYFIKR